MALSTLPQRTPRPLDTLTAAQVERLFEAIATQANALRQFCMEANCEGRAEAGGSFYIAQQAAAAIGLIADTAIGGQCVGGVNEWLVGGTVYG